MIAIVGEIFIDNFLNNFLDPKFVEKKLRESFPNTMETLNTLTKSDMIYRRRVNIPKIRSGMLLQNINYYVYKEKKVGFYAGSIYVNNAVRYSRIHELGGIIKRTVNISKIRKKYSGNTVQNFYKNIKLGYRKQTAEITANYPPRPYLWPSLFERGFKLFYELTYESMINSCEKEVRKQKAWVGVMGNVLRGEPIAKNPSRIQSQWPRTTYS
jgi:hypothetical protein